LGVRPGTIYSWLSRGIDIPYVKIKGTVRFREKAVQDWLLKKEQEQKKRNFELREGKGRGVAKMLP
jgi:predicted DNA-binding transcriptional regulator AlpA